MHGLVDYLVTCCCKLIWILVCCCGDYCVGNVDTGSETKYRVGNRSLRFEWNEYFELENEAYNIVGSILVVGFSQVYVWIIGSWENHFCVVAGAQGLTRTVSGWHWPCQPIWQNSELTRVPVSGDTTRVRLRGLGQWADTTRVSKFGFSCNFPEAQHDQPCWLTRPVLA